MIEIFPDKNKQAGAKSQKAARAGEEEHFPHFSMPLVVHALSELLEGDPGIAKIPGENIRVQPDQVFSEINQEQSADPHGHGRARGADNRGNEQAAG